VIGAVPIEPDEHSTSTEVYMASKFNAHLERLALPDHEFKLRDFYTGNFSIRRTNMLQVGGYDEAFRVYGNEDLELVLRLRQAGTEIFYSPAARARQHYTKNFAALARDNLAKGRTAVLLAGKHPETFSELKLASYSQGSLQWRTARQV